MTELVKVAVALLALLVPINGAVLAYVIRMERRVTRIETTCAIKNCSTEEAIP